MARTPDKDDSLQTLIQRLDATIEKPSSRIVAFISARPGEGTSTIARDYALALADMGEQEILLIDAGKVDKDFFAMHGADPANALADVVAAGKNVHDALYALAPHLRLGRWAKPGRGRGAINKLMKNDKFWTGLREHFGTVVIDAPSLLDSADGVALAARADAAVIVVEAEATRAPVIEHLRDALNLADAKIAGIVMNKRRYYIPTGVYQRI
ncbi:MAG: hypothetical protein KGI37_03810 [Alphaproteobacteria bacterium]|nr:hypothetical protein [Alphaproteobacteria bacterium]